MDSEIDAVCALLRRTLESSSSGRILAGIAGIPGAGKTVFARAVCDRLKPLCVVVPMDGVHFYRSELDEFPDPEEAHRRRGAPFTFNRPKFVALLESIRSCESENESVFAPSFDHRVKDPVEDDIQIDKSRHKIVLCEGNYLLLDDWECVRNFFDVGIFLDCGIDVAMDRVRRRHMAELQISEDEARQRIRTNDRLNAEEVFLSRKNADLVVKSLDDENFC